MDILFNIISIGFLVGVCIFILPFFGEMFFEVILLWIERIDYGKFRKSK